MIIMRQKFHYPDKNKKLSYDTMITLSFVLYKTQILHSNLLWKHNSILLLYCQHYFNIFLIDTCIISQYLYSFRLNNYFNPL